MDWNVVGDWARRELTDLGSALVALAVALVQALAIVLVARLLVGWSGRRVRRPRLIARLGHNLTSLAANVVAIVIYVVAFSLVLAVFGVSVSAVVAYLSVTTLAVGLALQETLRNVIAGIYLLLERPFNLGDRVALRDVSGRLESVDLRTSSIRSESGDLVLVPNSIVFTEIVTNRTATRATRTRAQATKLPLSPVEAQSRILALLDRLDGLRRPDPLVETIAESDQGATVAVSVWHEPDEPVRTRLIGLLRDAVPESEVSSAPTSLPDAFNRPRPRLGLYGGTFDPPHIGHLIIASEIGQALGLDTVRFIPAGVPPHKDPAGITPVADRLAMLELAIAGNPRFAIDTIELDRDGRSYTAETLATIHGREPGADLWFLMGGDSLADLHTWRTPEAILAIARLAVAVRPGWDIDLALVAARVPATAGRVDVVPTPLIDIASHDLRDRVRRGGSIRYLVPDAVARYIDDRGLYGVDQRRP